MWRSATDLATLQGKCDRALLFYGFAGALRRSELVAINLSHIEAHERGHLLTIPFSKGDQEGQGQTIPILAQPDSPYCPVMPLQAWVTAAKISEGAVFVRLYRGDTLSDKRLGDRAVAKLIKERIYQMKDPSLSEQQFSGHSLRRGFLTSVGKQQADLLKLKVQSRHARVDTVLGCIDNPEPFAQHAAEMLLQSESNES